MTITSVGSVAGNAVELNTLKAYLTAQYRGMGGAEIASHRKFCDHAPGRTTLTVVSAADLPEYLSEQYEGMGGDEIACHSSFLRNCPKVLVGGPYPPNLATRVA
jgi:hypothetical protein